MMDKSKRNAITRLLYFSRATASLLLGWKAIYGRGRGGQENQFAFSCELLSTQLGLRETLGSNNIIKTFIKTLILGDTDFLS